MQRVGEGRGRRFRCSHRLVSRFRCSHRLVSRFVPAFRSFGVGFQQLCWRLTAAWVPWAWGFARLFLKDGAKIRHFCRASKFCPPIWADFQHRFAQFSAASVTRGGKASIVAPPLNIL